MCVTTDRDRLIELIIKSKVLCNDCGESSNTYCAEALAEYLIENGVIVPPCKVGETVYKTVYDCAKGIRYNPFNENGYSTAQICLKCDTYPCNLHKVAIPVIAEDYDWIWDNRKSFGKTVFLAKEEAEKALKENKDNER